MVDWSAGRYETTADGLMPVAEVVVDRSEVGPGDDVVDLACGTGNAALLAAARGARVLGIDGAPRLLAVACERATAQGLQIEFREGDLLSLPVEDDAADVALSVYGVVFAGDPAAALREVAQVLRSEGRAFVTAWIPAGPIDAMIAVARQIMPRVASTPPAERFAWSDPDVVGGAAHDAGLVLAASERAELAIRAASPEAYVEAGREHPVMVAMKPMLDRSGVAADTRAAMARVLQEANEDPSAFLVPGPYVIHELRHTR